MGAWLWIGRPKLTLVCGLMDDDTTFPCFFLLTLHGIARGCPFVLSLLLGRACRVKKLIVAAADAVLMVRRPLSTVTITTTPRYTTVSYIALSFSLAHSFEGSSGSVFLLALEWCSYVLGGDHDFHCLLQHRGSRHSTEGLLNIRSTPTPYMYRRGIYTCADTYISHQ